MITRNFLVDDLWLEPYRLRHVKRDRGREMEMVVSAGHALGLAEEVLEAREGWYSPVYLNGLELFPAITRNHSVTVPVDRIEIVLEALELAGLVPTIAAKFEGKTLAAFELAFANHGEAVFCQFMI